jgi:hypothetical protein
MYLFISCLYMFRVSQCSSSGDRIVLIHHLVWLVCASGCLVRRPPGQHTKQPLAQTNHTRWYINTICDEMHVQQNVKILVSKTLRVVLCEHESPQYESHALLFVTARFRSLYFNWAALSWIITTRWQEFVSALRMESGSIPFVCF